MSKVIVSNEKIEFESEAESIIAHSDEHASVGLVICGTNGYEAVRINYQVASRVVNWMSPGPSRYDGDVWSVDMDVSDFVKSVSGYDLIYLWSIDSEFENKYIEAFSNPDSLEEHRLYYVSLESGKIKISDVEE